jgi:hypothetical protein
MNKPIGSDFDPETLVTEVALAMFAAEDTPEASAAVWEAYSADEQAGMLDMARTAIRAFSQGIARHGLKLLPPNAMPRPTTAQEAGLMMGAAKQFFEGQQRKTKLVGTPGLILPGRMQ